MQVGDLVRGLDTMIYGIVIGEVLQGCDLCFVQWNNGDMYSLAGRQLEVVSHV